jgi:RNA polymerase sigma-70 factor (ECF subfamily)
MAAPLAHDADLPAYAQSLIRVKARQLMRRTGFSRSDEEDLRQELTVRLVQYLPKFDPGRAGQNTFIARVVDSSVKMILRDRKRQKRAAGFVARSLDATVGVYQGRPITGGDLVNEADQGRRLGREAEPQVVRIDRRLAVSGVLANMSPKLREVCQRLMSGTEASVARDLGVSRHWMQSAIVQIRKRFEAAGLKKP